MRRPIIFVLLFGVSLCLTKANEEDNLRNALNSLSYRQKQLASDYYDVPNKEIDNAVRSDGDQLIYLDPRYREYGNDYRKGPVYGHPKPVYKEEELETDSDEYQERLKDRLMERLMLDILENEEQNRDKVKRSFFRERDGSSDALQNLYSPDADTIDEQTLFGPNSPFRERTKPKPFPNLRRGMGKDEQPDEEYENLINLLSEKYRGPSPKDDNADVITPQELEEIIEYFMENGGDNDQQKTKRGSEHMHKQYQPNEYENGNEGYVIQKRSANIEKTAENSTAGNGTETKSDVKNLKNRAGAGKKVEKIQKLKPIVEKTEKPAIFMYEQENEVGQKEVPISVDSQRPLNVKKKSVDWNEYFGVDKRSVPVPFPNFKYGEQDSRRSQPNPNYRFSATQLKALEAALANEINQLLADSLDDRNVVLDKENFLALLVLVDRLRKTREMFEAGEMERSGLKRMPVKRITKVKEEIRVGKTPSPFQYEEAKKKPIFADHRHRNGNKQGPSGFHAMQ